MNRRNGFGSGFILGSVVGGVVGGILGTLLATRNERQEGNQNQSFHTRTQKYLLIRKRVSRSLAAV